MSFQWTVIGGFLYVELGLTVLLMLPFISPSTWQRLFQSSLIKMTSRFANHFFGVFFLLLGICFADSIREMYKYQSTEGAETSMTNNPMAVDHVHMKLFRAQRNFYIAGFSLFLSVVIHRLVSLISSEATLTASKEAAIKQAKSASDAARRLMDEKDKDNDGENSKNELDELRAKLRETRKSLETKEADLAAMKTQAESTNREYDRLSEEHQKLQEQMNAGDKKSD